MTSREYLSRLVTCYCQERFGQDSIEIDCYDDLGATVFLDSLEELLADFERWRAVYEIRQQRKAFRP